MSFNHLYLLVILLAALCDAQANIESVSHHDLPSHRLWTAQYQPQNQKFHEYLLPLTEKQIVNHRMTKHFKLTKYSDLPEAYDVHTLFANKCKQSFTILSQGSCGSCWAFGSTESLQDRLCITYGIDQRLSEQYLLSCDGMDGGCNGGDQGNAWKFFNYFGLPQDSCMPYVSGNDSDHMPACPAKCADGSVMKKFYAASAYAVNKNEYDIMQEIYKNGPVTTGYTVFSDFDNYKGGIYHHTEGRALGGHAVEIVGWGVENGVPFWRVRNSWAPTWGENGYFRILRGTDECGIESDVAAGLPAASPSPPPAPAMPIGIPMMSRSIKTQFELILSNYHLILNGTGSNYWVEKSKGSVLYRTDSYNGAILSSTEIISTTGNYTVVTDYMLQRKTCERTAGYDDDDVIIPSAGLIMPGATFVDYMTMDGTVVMYYTMNGGPMKFDWYVAPDVTYPGLYVPIKTTITQTSKTSIMKNTVETEWYV